MEKSLGVNPQDPETNQASPESTKTTYAAVTRTSHTTKSSSNGLPQDKRLLNMENSVSAIQRDYITKSEVEEMVKQNISSQTIPDSVVTPDTINSMIDSKLEDFSQSQPDTHSSLSEKDVQNLIDSTLAKCTHGQGLIDALIETFRKELAITHDKLAKSILAVSASTKNLSESITALQNQNKDLTDLILEKNPDPAISHEKLTGAKAK